MRSLRVQTGFFACCLTAASIGLLSGCGDSEPSTTNTATEPSPPPAPVAPASRETDPASAIAPATLPESDSAAAKDETEDEFLAHDAVAAVRPPPADIYLSRLAEESVEFWEYKPNWGFNTNGFIGLRDETNPENKIVLGGIPSPHGIFAHPPPNGQSSVKYQIGDFGYSTFSSTVGVADVRQYGPNTPLSFEIYGDGKELWKSKPVDRWGIPQETGPVDIAGVQQLELRVVCPGDGGFAFAVWCEPRLIHSPPPSPLEGDGPITLAVLRFEDQGTSVEFNRLGSAIAEMLAHDLREYRKLRILERTAAGNLIEERDLAEANIVAGDGAAAEKLTAQYLVTGSCNASAGKLTVTANLTKVGDETPLETWQHTGVVDDFKNFEAALVKQVAEALHATETLRRRGAPSTIGASPTLAIFPLKNNGPDAELDVMQEGFADILQSSLGAIEGVKLVDRSEIERVLSEQSLSLSGLVDVNAAVQVGKLLEAERLLVGSFLSDGASLDIQVRVIDTPTGIVLASELVSGSRDEFAALLEDLTLQLLSDLSLEPADEMQSLIRANLPARSLETAIHMATGLRLFKEGRYPRAIVSYQQVLLLEPGNMLGYKRLMNLLWMLEMTETLEKTGDQALAREEFTLATAETRAEVLWLMAQIYSVQNRYPQLVQVTDRIIAEFPEAKDRANVFRGLVLIRLGQWNQGVKLIESGLSREPDLENDYKDASLKELYAFYAYYSGNLAPPSARTSQRRAEMCRRAVQIFDRIVASCVGKQDPYAKVWAHLLVPGAVDHLMITDEQGVSQYYLKPAEKVDMMQRALEAFGWDALARAEALYSLGVSAEEDEQWELSDRSYREYLQMTDELAQMPGKHHGLVPSMFHFVQPEGWLAQKIETYSRLGRVAQEGLRQPDNAAQAYQDMIREVGLVNFRGSNAVAGMYELDIQPEYPEKCALVWGWDTSGQRSWERVLGPLGYKVHGVRCEVITPAHLAPYSLIILERPEGLIMTPNDILALRSFVASGGSLLVIVSPGWEPSAPSNHRGLLSFFDMDVGAALPTRTTSTRIVPHEITDGITEVTAKSAVALKAPAESILIAAGDDALLAAREYRFGRVVVAAFGQWYVPDPSIFPDGWRNYRSRSHWTAQLESPELPIDEGEALHLPLLNNVIAWLEAHPNRGTEFDRWRDALQVAHWTALNAHSQSQHWDELAEPIERAIAAAPDAVAREESLWMAGDAYLWPTCYTTDYHLQWPSYSYGRNRWEAPEPDRFIELIRLNSDTPLLHVAQWRVAECERLNLVMDINHGRRGWNAKDIGDAMAAYAKVEALPGSHAWAWTRFRQGSLTFSANEKDKSYRWMKELADGMPLGPERTLALVTAADAAMHLGKNFEARRIYEELNSIPNMSWSRTSDRLTVWFPVSTSDDTARIVATAGLAVLKRQQ